MEAKLSPRILDTLDPCVVLMKDMIGKYAHLWEDKGGIFSLAQGVVYWEPPSSCQEALLEAIKDPSSNMLHMYGPEKGIPQLSQALEEKLATENGLDQHNVMVTVGANQAYVNCVLTCLSDESKSIIFKPYYFNHAMAMQMCCGKESVVVGPCDEEGMPDLAWLEEALTSQSVDMVTLVNPGNPTGVSLPRDYLQKMVDICGQHSVWLVLDCTYEYFTIPEHQPIATFPQASHVIHIFSLSKSYSLAGYRCGYVVMHKDHPQLWNNMLKVQDTLPIGPPRLTQIAATGALRAGRQWVYDKYATLDTSRELILDALSPMAKTMGGSGAMYVMGRLPIKEDGSVMDDVEVCRQLVELHGLATIPGSFCGFPGWIRVCYANLTPTVCEQAAERLKSGLESILKTSGTD